MEKSQKQPEQQSSSTSASNKFNQQLPPLPLLGKCMSQFFWGMRMHDTCALHPTVRKDNSIAGSCYNLKHNKCTGAPNTVT